MKINKDLIGNISIFLAENCSKPLYHTKLLKLLYLIDEEATKRTGSPITWLTYNVWQFGPVSEDIYFSKQKGYNKLSQFVKFEDTGNNAFIIRPVARFDRSEFTDLDLEIITDIVAKYGRKTVKQLIEITHEKGSLWETTKRKADIQFTGDNKTSNVTLNFADLLGDDGLKKTIYYSTLENIDLQSTLT